MLIPKSAFSVVTAVASEDTRYAISSVQVERAPDGRAVAVATDGRRLHAMEWDDVETRAEFPDVGLESEAVEGFAAIIPPAEWKAAGKSIPKGRKCFKPILGHAQLEEPGANGVVKFATTDGQATSRAEVPTVEGKFPKWRDVVPAYKVGTDAIEIGVNAHFLADAAMFAESVCNPESRGVRLTIPTNPAKPMTLTATHPETGAVATAVVMPVTLGVQPYGWAAGQTVDQSPVTIAGQFPKHVIVAVEAVAILKAAFEGGELSHELATQARCTLLAAGEIQPEPEPKHEPRPAKRTKKTKPVAVAA